MEKEKKVKSNPIAVALYILFWIVLVIMFFMLFVGQMDDYNELNEELSQLSANIAEAKISAEQLEIQMSFFDSDSYMEYLARKRGMVKQNEIIFRNIAD